MDKKSVFEVTVEIGASPNKYWGSLAFTDRKGKLHKKDFTVEKQGTKHANTLKAIIKALDILELPCLLTIHTDMDYLISAYQNNWLHRWRENDWKKANGKELKNKELWQQVSERMSDHSIKFIKEEQHV